MATRVEIEGDRSSFLRIAVGFLPLAFGYFLSVLFQRIDPLVADDLIADLAIGKGTLGILTAAFPLAFALCLLPSGIAIDRFGPRAVQSVMMGVTALGALIVSVSTGSVGLMMGRALLGAGAASALLAAMQAIATWFPRERLGLATGCLITVAGLGALAMAGPLFAYANGWRGLFMLLAALAALGAVLAVLLVPTPATVTGDVPDQDHGLTFVLRDPVFRRLAPLAAIAVGTVWATQGQWIAGWFATVNGVRLTDIITYVTLIAVGQTAGALILGWLADWAAGKGSSAASVFVGAVALGVGIQLAAVVGIGLPSSIVWGALVAGAAAVLPFVVVLTHFPQACAARACASVAVLQYAATLFVQWAVGGVVAIWPLAASGQTSATAYAMAFLVPIALQFAALAWFLLPRSETRDGAPGVGEAAAFERQMQGLSKPPPIPDGLPSATAAAPASSADGPADAAIEPVDIAPAPTETVGETEVAALEPAKIAETLPDTVTEPAGLAAEPHDAAAITAASAEEPADAAVAPIDTVSGATETAGETDVADTAPDETEEAPTDTPAEPDSLTAEPPDAATTPAVETAGVTAETVAPSVDVAVALTDAALRSILGAPLSPVGAIDTTSRADASIAAAPDHSAEMAQPQAQELSFPLVAPSHVPALNAVYRRRPALAAMIGGRETTIVAAWPPPDRLPDLSHRLALRLDGESGELWLPPSLVDMLVDSVDPVLSLDRLGPDRAAIILEFALDSALAAVEMHLGCRLEIEAYSGQVERLENDGQVPLCFNLVIEGLATAGCELRIPGDHALRLAEGLDRHAGIDHSVLDVPIPVCLRVAAANLAAGEVERLSPDDVVLVDASCEPGDAVIAVIGERLVAPVALGPEGPHLATYPIPGATSSWAWSMPTDAMAGAWEADAQTDSRPLHVLFELGRFELPASQVKQLAPNFLLPLEPPRDRMVDIVVEGQRIGRGTLMRIGNRTGVRIVAVRERPRHAAGLKRAPAVEGTSFE